MLIKDNPFIEGRSQSFSENQKIAERNSQSGFSLIELLIAVVLFTIVITSAYGLLEAARGSRSVVNQQVQTMQSARNALNTFGRDVLNAGYGDFRQSGNGAYMPDGSTFNGIKNILPDEYFNSLKVGDVLNNDVQNPLIWKK